MVLWCVLKLVIRRIASGAFCERFWCRPRSVAIYVYLGAAWWELQSDLLLVATCSVLIGVWEKLYWELRTAAISSRLGTLLWVPQCELRPAANSAELMAT